MFSSQIRNIRFGAMATGFLEAGGARTEGSTFDDLWLCAILLKEGTLALVQRFVVDCLYN